MSVSVPVRSARSFGPYLVLASLMVGVAVAIRALHAQAPAAPAGPFDLGAAAHGGRVEWTTYEFRSEGEGVAMNLLAATRHAGWLGGQGENEIVFSFFNRQLALVAGVEVNPVTRNLSGRPKDVEIWTSTKSATEAADFTKAASAALMNEDKLQLVAFPPVEARFVKLRILNTNAPAPPYKPGDLPAAASRVRILEGSRPGYSSILTRHPALAALAKGVIPAAPPAAALPVPPATGPATCAAPAAPEPPKKSTFAQSRRVLVVTDNPNGLLALWWKTSATDTLGQEGRLVLPGVEYTWVTTAVASPAHLIADDVDTVLFPQVCGIDTDLSTAFKQALLAWIAAGHKVIIQDSDLCAGPNTPKYSFLPYPFATSNPGAAGARGEAGVIENSTLVSSDSKSPAFIDTAAWAAGNNDLGDSNVVVQYDARWCGSMWAKNKLRKNGMTLAYAHYGRGLIIYDGLDYDQGPSSPIYRKLVGQELLQPFDPDYLPCSQPLGGFMITTKAEQKSQPMAPGRTYTYPINVLGNFDYSGVVALEANVIPADPAVSVKLSARTADLTTLDEATASLTVTTGPGASLKSKVISVRGLDKAGKSNVLCLDLPERKTGGVTIVSALRKDKPPTKNLEIILDASGSMRALLGKQTRWATAQAVLKDVVSKLPKDFSVGLRAYGHTLPSTNPKTCTDSSLVVPVEPLNPANFLAVAGRLVPRGETPLVYSILQTPGDLKDLGGGTVILITDGEESCKGDFAAAAKTLKDAGMNLTLNIVGFTLKNAPAQASLTGLAESTGGHYYPANSGEALARSILLAAVDRLPYRILEASGKEVARGEAGVDGAHELPPGAYTVVVMAGDTEVRTPLTVAVGQDITLRASINGDKLVIER